jgi:hypothetical protein
MDRYPVQDDKIDMLVASMEQTGFWDNVVARKRGKQYELAYGHHRWIAFQKKYGDNALMPLIVKNLSDEKMLQVMANENMQEFGTSATVEIESVRAVVLAYAEGKIELEKPKNLGGKGGRADGMRYAPSFKPGFITDSNKLPYTVDTVANFLGWVFPNGQPNRRVRNALEALEVSEEYDAETPELPAVIDEIATDLRSSQMKETLHQMKKVQKAHEEEGATKKEAKAKAVEAGKKVAEEMRKRNGKTTGEGSGIREAGKVAEEFLPASKKPPKAEKPKEYPSTRKFQELMQFSNGFSHYVQEEFGLVKGENEPDYAKMVRDEGWDHSQTFSCVQTLRAHIDDMERLKDELMNALTIKDRETLSQ